LQCGGVFGGLEKNNPCVKRDDVGAFPDQQRIDVAFLDPRMLDD
jgi:hypothetical protein